MTSHPTLHAKGLHHVAYCTRDPEATYDFYSKKLGMPLVHTENHKQGEGHMRHFFFDLGDGNHLAFFEVSNVGEDQDFRTSISVGNGLPIWVNHIAFRLDHMEDLRAMTELLKQRGLDEMSQIDHGWCHSIYMTDPNGILVEFCVTTDPETFHQSEEEALRLLRQPPENFDEATRKEGDSAKRV